MEIEHIGTLNDWQVDSATEEETNEDQQQFTNRLRILINIDSYELPVNWNRDMRVEFMQNPYRFFIQCSHTLQDDLWEIIKEREAD